MQGSIETIGDRRGGGQDHGRVRRYNMHIELGPLSARGETSYQERWRSWHWDDVLRAFGVPSSVLRKIGEWERV